MLGGGCVFEGGGRFRFFDGWLGRDFRSVVQFWEGWKVGLVVASTVFDIDGASIALGNVEVIFLNNRLQKTCPEIISFGSWRNYKFTIKPAYNF